MISGGFMERDFGNGSNTLTQETTTSSQRLLRGYYGVTRGADVAVSYASAAIGWRPVLELME